MRNLGQCRCRRCNRPHWGCLNAGCISDKQWKELVDYAKANGRRWKSKLRETWLTESRESTLRWARNLLGPSGLDKVILDAQQYERKLAGRIRVLGPRTKVLIENWFDPYDHDHIKAWRHLCEKGSWPEDFIPDYVDRQSGWQILLANKLAEAWVDHITAKEYVESTP